MPDLDLGAQQSGQDASGRTPEQAAGLKREGQHQAAVARLVGTLRDPSRATTRLSDAFRHPRRPRKS